MKPIDYAAIENAARLRAVDADHFLDTLRTLPVHWTALCDAAAALSEAHDTYSAMHPETRAIVADAVELNPDLLRTALFALEAPAKPPTPALLKLLEALYPDSGAGVPAELKGET